MPVKLSGELVEEARQTAKLQHRSLTSQIEHWAAIGRAVESQMSGEAVAKLLEDRGASLKIADVADRAQRELVVGILAAVLKQEPEMSEHPWLADLSERGVPLYGTKQEGSGIICREPNGDEKPFRRPPSQGH